MAKSGSRTPSPVPVLTGSIGSGKTAVSDIFESFGVVVIDSDKMARTVVEPGTEGLREVVLHFGENVLTQDGHLNRKRLAERIFCDPEEKEALERILHPKIREASNSLRNEALARGEKVLLVIPLYFETRIEDPSITHIIVVSAPEKQCLERVCLRDGITPELAQKIFNSQLPPSEKIAKADFVISNDSTLDSLVPQVREVIAKIWEQE
ncbi:MAG: dephospho-CoA kinase [Bdellovibrionales bacterium]|nr:dephospho-CoA kinase [Bdellovibrionales bacterium]